MQTAIRSFHPLLPAARSIAPCGLRQKERATPRTRTIYRLALARTDIDSGICRVQNISDGGMMLMSRMVVDVGSSISVELSNNIVLLGRVVWAAELRIGIRFSHRVDSAAILSRLADEQQGGWNRLPRLDVHLWGTATSEGGVQSIRVLNLSRQGMKIAHNGSLSEGDAVKVVLENGIDRRGIVRWSTEKQAGVKLLEPIPGEKLESAFRLAAMTEPHPAENLR